MTDFEYIETYFSGANTPEEQQAFEKRIAEDPAFANDVAFYIAAGGIIYDRVLEEKKQRFRQIYRRDNLPSVQSPVKKAFWRYAVAAAVIVAAVTAGLMMIRQKNLPERLADQYISENWKTLSTTMNAGLALTGADSLQQAIDAYNDGKPQQALSLLEEMYQKDTLNYFIKKYSGIVSLQLKQYDKALGYFSSLANDTVLQINPGKLYIAVALLKRNKDNDNAAAREILTEIAGKGLQGKEEAIKWLEELK